MVQHNWGNRSATEFITLTLFIAVRTDELFLWSNQVTALGTPKAIARREDKQQRKRLGQAVQKGDSWSSLSLKCPHTIDWSFVANHNYITEQKAYF